MLKSQTYNPSINFRTSNSPPFPVNSTVSMSNQPPPPNLMSNHIPFAATNPNLYQNPSNNMLHTYSSSNLGHISSASTSSINTSSSSQSKAQQQLSHPSNASRQVTSTGSQSGTSSLSNSASSSTTKIMSASTPFYPSVSGFQSFIPSQYNQNAQTNNSFASSNNSIKGQSIVPPNMANPNLSIAHQAPPQQSQSSQPQPSNSFFSSSVSPILDDANSNATGNTAASNYPCLAIMNLPRDIQEREFEILFTFANEYLYSELQKSHTIAEDGLPTAVGGLVYFKTLSAANTAYATLTRNTHLFTPKEYLARSSTLSTSPFAITVEIRSNRSNISADSLSSMSRLGSFNMNSAISTNGATNNTNIHRISNGTSNLSQSQSQTQYKNMSRFIFPTGNGATSASNGTTGSTPSQQQQQQQQQTGQQQQQPQQSSLEMHPPQKFQEIYEGGPINNSVFSPASPRGIFPMSDEFVPRMTGKSLLLESQGREDEEYNDIVKDVGVSWFSQGGPSSSTNIGGGGNSSVFAVGNSITSPGYNSYSNNMTISQPSSQQISPQENNSASLHKPVSPPNATTTTTTTTNNTTTASASSTSPSITNASTSNNNTSLGETNKASDSKLAVGQQLQGQTSSQKQAQLSSSNNNNNNTTTTTTTNSSTASSNSSSSAVVKPGSQSPTKGKTQVHGKPTNTGGSNNNNNNSINGGYNNSNNKHNNTTSNRSTTLSSGSSSNNNNNNNQWNINEGNKKNNRNSTTRSFQNLSINGNNSTTHSGGATSASGVSSSTSSNNNNNGGGNSPVEGNKIVVPYSPTNGTNAIHIMQNGGRVLPPANPADQNPPCNTLYVGNLPPDTNEDELKDLFSTCRGYKRLCFRTKANGPMCFVEFEDVTYATRALEELYGIGLSNSVKGGIRLSFSKNPLGVKPQNNNNNNMSSGGNNNSSSSSSSNNNGNRTKNYYNNSNNSHHNNNNISNHSNNNNNNHNNDSL